MKVHFSASVENIADNINTYRSIRTTIRKNNSELVRDWIEEAYKRRNSQYDSEEAVQIVNYTQQAIADCDVVILDATQQSFGIGYQAALASSLQKPLLILQRAGSKPLGTIGIGTDSILRSHRFYASKQDLFHIISNFIRMNSISTKDLRFNMVLERDLFYYLNNESALTGIPKSQIVRNLIRQSAHNKNHLTEKI